MEMRFESRQAYWKRSHLGFPHMDVDNAEKGTYRGFALVFSVVKIFMGVLVKSLWRFPKHRTLTKHKEGLGVFGYVLISDLCLGVEENEDDFMLGILGCYKAYDSVWWEELGCKMIKVVLTMALEALVVLQLISPKENTPNVDKCLL